MPNNPDPYLVRRAPRDVVLSVARGRTSNCGVMAQYKPNGGQELCLCVASLHRINLSRDPLEICWIISLFWKALDRIDMVNGVVHSQNKYLACVRTTIVLLLQFIKRDGPQFSASQIAKHNLFQVALFTSPTTLRPPCLHGRSGATGGTKALFYRPRFQLDLSTRFTPNASCAMNLVRASFLRFTRDTHPVSFQTQIIRLMAPLIVNIWPLSCALVFALTFFTPRIKSVSRVSGNSSIERRERFVDFAVGTLFLGYDKVSHAFNALVIDV